MAGDRQFGLVWVAIVTAALVTAAPVAAPALAAAPSGRPPNVVLLIADDLGINDLSCYGRGDQPTPAIDRLAAGGVRFSGALSAASVCSPSRVAILTGLHPARVGITTFLPGRADRASHKLLSPAIPAGLPGGVATLAERLGPAGYRSHYVGKWHLGGAGSLPTDRGFLTHATGGANPGAESPEGGKGEARQAEEAARVIASESREHPATPFFLVVGFDTPHVPLAAPAAEVTARRGTFHPTYAAMIASLDRAVGRIVAAIEEADISDDTLLVFTSDNGGLHVPEVGDPPPTFNAPSRAGKGFLYDGGLRVPLIVRFPGGAERGREVDAPVSTGDVAPTICRLAGVAAPDEADFRDLAEALHPPEPREPVASESREPVPPRTYFWHQPHATNQGGRPAGAIRRGPWKLVEHFEDGRLELYDVSADPGESRDRAADEPALVAGLRGLLEGWRREVGARGMTANPRFDPAAWQACHGAVDVSRLGAAATAAEMMPALAAWRAAMDDPAAGPPATRNGFIRLAASAAAVEGEKLRYEPPAEKDTLGYWVDADDRAWWDFHLDEPGRYRVGILQACGAGQGGSVVELAAGEARLEFTVEETGHFQRFVPRDVGTLDLPAGTVRLTVRARSKKAAAVMDLRQVTLERIE